ncbi:MAG TPA: ABC transporter substrate-binding protein [Acidimicrobiia bacterium]|nr:ABC transporter substrate-binding protein [Acidimicrobiia bacterium]
MASACGNSKSQNQTTDTTGNAGPAATAAPAADLTKFVAGRGPGVDDNKKEIRVAAITTKTNPIGGKYAEYVDGMQAYFDKINAAGGIYGRKLVIVKNRDDTIGLQNNQQVQQSLADDNAFATFVATLQFTGADLLAKAKQPTFTWNINPEMATPKGGPSHANIFGSLGALCFSCGGHYLPWLAKQNNFTKIGILAYSKATSASSGLCADGTRRSYEKFAPTAKVVFFDDSLPFSADIVTDVTRMKQAGVQFINTCMDTNEVTKLAREMKKQGLNAVQQLPNAYDHEAMAASGGVFEGNFISPLYVPWEVTPQSPATQEYLAYTSAHNVKTVELTQDGWIMAAMFLDALKLAGPEFTKQKVIDALNTQKGESPGGMIVPIDWTRQHNDPTNNVAVRSKLECASIMKIVGGKFVPQYSEPGKPWSCFDADPNAPIPVQPQHLSFAPGGVG